MKTAHQNPKITRVLAQMDRICSRLAVHTDRLASLAVVRDDRAITVAALESEQVCRALHALFADMAGYAATNSEVR